jgi:hypothetical protein
MERLNAPQLLNRIVAAAIQVAWGYADPHLPAYNVRISIAWRSLSSLASVVDLALRQSLDGKFGFPNPNLAAVTVVRGDESSAAQQRSTARQTGGPRRALLEDFFAPSVNEREARREPRLAPIDEAAPRPVTPSSFAEEGR